MTVELDIYRKNYENTFGTVDFKSLKKDFHAFMDYDDTLVYEYRWNGLERVIEILEHRLFTFSATSRDIKFLAFITRNKSKLKIILNTI